MERIDLFEICYFTLQHLFSLTKNIFYFFLYKSADEMLRDHLAEHQLNLHADWCIFCKYEQEVVQPRILRAQQPSYDIFDSRV